MTNQKTRFTGEDSVLAITMRQGKSGINVASTIRTPGENASTGTRSTHKNEKAAQAAFDQLCDDARKRDWTEKVRRSGAGFDTIPSPVKADPKKVAAQAKAKIDRAAKRAARKTKKEDKPRSGGRPRK